MRKFDSIKICCQVCPSLLVAGILQKSPGHHHLTALQKQKPNLLIVQELCQKNLCAFWQFFQNFTFSK